MHRYMTRTLAALAVSMFLMAGCDGGSDLSERTDDGFGLLVVGDFGTGTENARDVSEAMRSWTDENAVDAFVTTGDNVYPSGSPDRFDAAWNEPFAWVEENSLPVLASLGNHDIRHEGGAAVMDLLGMPAPWYSTKIKDADILVLDSNQPTEPKQLRWLRKRLTDQSSAWQIVIFHHAPFSCTTSRDSDPVVVAEWMPLFEEHGVDLILTGHAHSYQRFAPQGGATNVVTGGGGAELYELDDCGPDLPSREAGDDDRFHFVTVVGDDSTLRVTARAVDGSVIDDFTLTPD